MPGPCIETQVTSPGTEAECQPALDAAARALRSKAEAAAPRWMLIFAHADDEVLALGAHLERLTASRILTLTDGAPVDGADARHHGFTSLADYRAARRQELLQALAHAGLPASVAPDLLTPVPDQQASLHLLSLTRAIAAEIETFRPDAVLTHPYEGGHPDHDACAFAVHTALTLLPTDHRPTLLEAPSYHAGTDGQMITGAFLSAPTAGSDLLIELTPEQQRDKQARLACFTSQAETLAQFSTSTERLRLAPHYDFTQPPHPGQLFYEQFPWGMTGDRFRELASEAIAALSREIGRTASLQAESTCEVTAV